MSRGVGISTAGVDFDNSDIGEDDTNSVSFSAINSGAITGVTDGGDAFGLHATSTGTGSITVTNLAAGTFYASPGGNVGDAIYANASGGGNITVDTSGTLMAVGGGTDNGLVALTTSGNITVDNASSGTGVISAHSGGTTAAGIYAQTETGTIDITNSSAITAIANTEAGATGVYAHATDTAVNGTISVGLTGDMTVTGDGDSVGIDTGNFTNSISVTDSGSIAVTTSSGDATGVIANANGSSASVNLTSAVTVTGTANATGISITGTPVYVALTGDLSVTGADDVYGINALNTGAGSTTIQSTASIDATSTAGSATGIFASSTSHSASGAIVIGLTGNETVSGDGTSYGVNAQNVSNGISFTTTGTLGVTATTGTATGIRENAGAGLAASATSSNTITVTADAGAATGINLTGSPVSTTLSNALTVNGTGTVLGITTLDNGAGDTTITDSTGSSIHATSSGGSASGINAAVAEGSTANIVVQNGGPITVSGQINGTGIQAISAGGNVTISTPTGGNGAVSATGATGAAIAIFGQATNGGAVSITAPQAISSTGYSSSVGLDASTTSGAITITSPSGGSGTINTYVGATGGTGTGIRANTASGAVTVTAENDITITGGYSRFFGIDVDSTGATAGNIQITSDGAITGITQSGSYNSTGILATSNGANITVNSTSAINTGSGSYAYGIYATTQTGAVTINSSGTITPNSNGENALAITAISPGHHRSGTGPGDEHRNPDQLGLLYGWRSDCSGPWRHADHADELLNRRDQLDLRLRLRGRPLCRYDHGCRHADQQWFDHGQRLRRHQLRHLFPDDRQRDDQ